MIEIAEELDVSLQIDLLQIVGRSLENCDLYLADEDIKEFKKDITEKKYVKYVSESLSSPQPIFDCPLLESNIKSLKIDYFGNVHMCQLLHQQQFCLGNCHCSSLKLILDTTDEKIEYMKNLLSNCCSSCNFKRHCGKGCIAKAFLDKEFISDGECLERKRIILNTFRSVIKDAM